MTTSIISFKPIELGLTPSGKAVQLVKKPVGNKVCRFIAIQGGGQLPAKLEGMWPDPAMAQKAVDEWLGSLAKEAEKKTTSRSTAKK